MAGGVSSLGRELFMTRLSLTCLAVFPQRGTSRILRLRQPCRRLLLSRCDAAAAPVERSQAEAGQQLAEQLQRQQAPEQGGEQQAESSEQQQQQQKQRRRQGRKPEKRRLPRVKRLEAPEVQALTCCTAIVELVLAQPPRGVSFAALDAALDQLLALGDRSSAEDRAAAARLADFAWRRVQHLQRWPLVRLLKMSVRFKVATPERLRAWQASLDAHGGMQGLTTAQAIDVLEAARILQLSEEMREAVGELDPKLLPTALDWVFQGKPLLWQLPLRRLSMVYNAVEVLGLELPPPRRRCLAGAVGAALQRGEWDAGRVAMIAAAWGSLAGQQSSSASSASSRGPSGGIMQGNPDNWVMEEVVARAREQRHQLGAWDLARLLGALGHLSYSPRIQVLADLVAALEPHLVGAKSAREVTAAVAGLVRLGADPGPAFAAACMAVARADGGRDQSLLSHLAWGLAAFKRCTPEYWAELVSMLEAREQAGSLTPVMLRHWLTGYVLMREQYCSSATQQQQQQQQRSSTGGSRGASGCIAALPDDVLSRAVVEARGTLESKAAIPSGYREVLAQVVRSLCAPASLLVEEQYRVEDPATGAPLVVDVAVPSLRLALQISRPHEVNRNAGMPTGAQLTRNRLLAHWGWRLVMVPGAGVLLADRQAALGLSRPGRRGAKKEGARRGSKAKGRRGSNSQQEQEEAADEGEEGREQQQQQQQQQMPEVPEVPAVDLHAEVRRVLVQQGLLPQLVREERRRRMPQRQMSGKYM